MSGARGDGDTSSYPSYGGGGGGWPPQQQQAPMSGYGQPQPYGQQPQPWGQPYPTYPQYPQMGYPNMQTPQQQGYNQQGGYYGGYNNGYNQPPPPMPVPPANQPTLHSQQPPSQPPSQPPAPVSNSRRASGGPSGTAGAAGSSALTRSFDEAEELEDAEAEEEEYAAPISTRPTTDKAAPAPARRSQACPPPVRSGPSFLSRETLENLRLHNEQLNKELHEKEEEIRVLQDEGSKGVLQQKLQRALLDNKELRQRLEEIKTSQQESESQLADNAALLLELESLKGELMRSKLEADQTTTALMEQNEHLKDELHLVETKLGAYERETAELEQEIEEGARQNTALQQQVSQLQATITNLRTGGRVAELEEKLQNCTQLLQTKEVENDTLLRELDALTEENEQLRALQSEHVQEVQVKHASELVRAHQLSQDRQLEIDRLHSELQSALDRASHLESMKVDHDATLLELRSKMAEYEAGYNLTDAVAEIRTLKTRLKTVDMERNQEKELINRREKELQRYVAENRQLKQLAGQPESWGLNPDELELQSQIELQKLQALHRTDAKIIRKLEADRMELLDELRKGSTDRTRDGLVYLGLDAEKTALVEEYVERLRNEDETLPQSDHSEALQQQVEQLTREVDVWKERYARAQVDKDEMSHKLMTGMERDKGKEYDQILKQLTELKANYNMLQLSQSQPAASHNHMRAIPESPAAGMRSPPPPAPNTSTTSSSAPPAPLPAGSSNELRNVVDKVSHLPLPEKHALFARLYQEFQPAAAAAPSTHAPSSVVSSMPNSRLISPRQGGAGAQGVDTSVFTFPSHAHPAALSPPPPSAAPSSSPSPSPLADAATSALLSLHSRELSSMDSATKARLLGALQEVLRTEDTNAQLVDQLEVYQVRMEKLAARQQMLYMEHNQQKKEWEEQKQKMKEELDQALQEKEQMELKLASTQPLDAPSSSSDPSSDSDPTPLRRRILLLETNEKILSRRYNSLQAQLLDRESTLMSTQKEFIEMEATLRQRVLELNKRKKLLQARVEHVQQLTKEWVPKEELFKIARKYNWLSAQYASLIAQQDLSLIHGTELTSARRDKEVAEAKLQQMEEELRIQQEKNEALRKALDQVELTMIPNPNPLNSKKQTLAQRMAQSAAGRGGTSQPASGAPPSIPSLLAELADVRAREEAASKRASRLDVQLASVNAHALEVEEELLTLRKQHHELSLSVQSEQEVIIQLRNDLEGAVPYHKANELQQRLLETREHLQEAQAQVAHYREIASLSTHQNMQLLSMRPEDPSSPDHEDLVRGLNRTIEDLEQVGDDQARLGKVHRENMSLKLKIRAMERELQATKQETAATRQQLTLVNRELDLKNTDLYRIHNHARTQLAEKEKELLEMTANATSSSSSHALHHPMTLQQAETIHQATVQMQVQLTAAKKREEELRAENEKYFMQVSELAIQIEQMQELNTLFPGIIKGKNKGLNNKGRNAGVAASISLDEDEDELPLPASLSLQGGNGGGGGSSALDSSEYALKLRQQLVHYSTQLSQHKLAAVRSAHTLSSLESKLSFQASELAHYEEQIAKLQQELIEKDHFIQTRDQEFKQQRLQLKEQETKLKLAQSLHRLEAKKRNQHLQRKAVATIKRITGQEAGGKGSGGDGDEDPFAAHEQGAASVSPSGNDGADELGLDDLDDEISRLSEQLDTADSANNGSSSSTHLLEGLLHQLHSKLRLAKSIMSDQRDRITDLEEEVSRIKDMKQADESAIKAAQEVAEMERARLLSTAQATIQSLHEQLATKSARIEKYQGLLTSAADKYHRRQAISEAEIERLNHLLLEKNSSNMAELRGAMTFLDELPRLPKDVVSRVEMETILSEKEELVGMMQKEVDFIKIQLQDAQEAKQQLKDQLQHLKKDQEAEVATLKSQVELLEQGRQDEAKLNKLVERLRNEMKTKDESLGQLQEALAQLKDQLLANANEFRKTTAPPTASSSGSSAQEDAAQLGVNPPLDQQVATLERKIKSLGAQLTKERQATQQAKDAANQHRLQLTEREEAFKALENTLTKRIEEAEALRAKLGAALAEQARLKELITKIKNRHAKEVEELKNTHAKETEMTERKRKLEAKMEARTAAGKGAAGEEKQDGSSTTPSAVPSSSSSTSVASKAFSEWEQDKKHGARILALQKRCDKQQSEVRTLQAAVDKLTTRLTKEQKEKLQATQRVQTLQAQLQAATKHFSSSSLANLNIALGVVEPAEGEGGEGGEDAPTPLSDADLEKALTKEQLKQQLFDLQESHDRLDRRVQVDFPAQVMQLQEELKSTTKKMEQALRDKRELERALKEANAGHTPSAMRSFVRNRSTLHSSGDTVDAAHLAQVESQLSTAESKVLELTMSNLDLKYSVAHSDILITRLRQRVQEQAALIKLVDGSGLSKELKACIPPEVKEVMDSLSEATAAATPSSSSSSSSAVAPYRALMLVFSSFRRIFEKLRVENESLTRNSHRNTEFMAMIKENKLLKKKLQALTEEVAAQAKGKEGAGGNNANGTANASASDNPNLIDRSEYDRALTLHTLTRKELKKEQELSTRLKKKLNDLAKELEAREQALAEAERQAQSAHSASSTDWYRKEKNLLATIDDLTRNKQAAEEEVKKLRLMLSHMKKQQTEMNQLIEHVKAQQQLTQEQVLQAAQVQAAVLSKTEEESSKERQLTSALHALTAERDRLMQENAAYKQELSAFDVQFFEELEDLKAAYAQAVQQVHTLNKQIDDMKKAERRDREKRGEEQKEQAQQ